MDIPNTTPASGASTPATGTAATTKITSVEVDPFTAEGMSEVMERTTKAFRHLLDVTRDAHTAAIETIAAKHIYTDAVNDILFRYRDDPKELGANEAARAAALDKMTQSEAEALESCKTRELMAKQRVERATIAVDSAKTTARLISATALMLHGGND